MQLALAGDRTVELDRLIELLERLVDDYDERRSRGALEALAPLELLQHLMEEGGLKQVDLVDCFGSQSVVSAVMVGKRRIHAEHARRLSRRFGLPLAMFLGDFRRGCPPADLLLHRELHDRLHRLGDLILHRGVLQDVLVAGGGLDHHPPLLLVVRVRERLAGALHGQGVRA